MKSNILLDPKTVNAMQELYQEKQGLLLPEHIVEYAEPDFSPLHKYFEWDDTEAARNYRIVQARSLINKVAVKMIMPNGKPKIERVFVHLESDRKTGGYRTMVDVLSDKNMRNELIRNAMVDMQLFETRYKEIRELTLVFSEIRKARQKLEKVGVKSLK